MYLDHTSDNISRFRGHKLWQSFHNIMNSIYSKFKWIFLVQKNYDARIEVPWIRSFKYQILEKYQVFFVLIYCDQVWSWNSNENIHSIWFCKDLGQTKNLREDIRRHLLRSVIIRCKNPWKILEELPGQECTLLRKGLLSHVYSGLQNIFEKDYQVQKIIYSNDS